MRSTDSSGIPEYSSSSCVLAFVNVALSPIWPDLDDDKLNFCDEFSQSGGKEELGDWITLLKRNPIARLLFC